MPSSVALTGRIFVKIYTESYTLLPDGYNHVSVNPGINNIPVSFKPTFAVQRGVDTPEQVLKVSWDNLAGLVEIAARSVDPPGPAGEPVLIDPGDLHRGSILTGVPIPHGLKPGDTYRVEINLRQTESDQTEFIEIELPDLDYRLYIGAGYHVDPVWWNTQRDYTEAGSRQGDTVNTFLELNRQYLEWLEKYPDFTCTLETVPAIHPTWLADPGLRDSIRELVRNRRLELVSSYVQPQSTMVGCELLCRTIAYGVGFAELLGCTKPPGLAQWDVFGHDPGWPAIGSAAGLKWTTFCRGLYHADHLEPEDNLFPSEFIWVAPDGSRHLTHYMSRHYTSGWEFLWSSMDEAEIPILDRFERLRITASTRNTFLPCYGDFAEPFEGMMDIVKAWNEKYLSPVMIVGTQDDYLSECRKRGIWLVPISRDMNPALSGCNLSFADTKIAQKEGERLVREAEIWSTFAALHGTEYPVAAIDRAWRILCYCSHHDAVTGSESDQVYLDLNALWREARDLGRSVSELTRQSLASLTSTPSKDDSPIITVFNSLGWKRSGPVTVNSEILDGIKPYSVIDKDGQKIRINQTPNGWVFNARDVPPLGWRNYSVNSQSRMVTIEQPSDPDTIENDLFRLKVDPSRSGSITSIIEKKTGTEFIRDNRHANEVVVYPEIPGMNMAPWLIQPTGERLASSSEKADLSREIREGFQSITSTFRFLGCEIEQVITLRDGEPFIDFRTSIRGYADRDHMWRVEFPVDLPGTRPVAQTSGGVIGRPYGRLGDFRELRYFGDWAVDTWGGLECPLVFRLTNGQSELHRSVSIGEIVIPDQPDKPTRDAIDRLVPLLAKYGVTSVVTKADGRRSGDWMKDGSRPDFRILLGKGNPLTNRLLASTDCKADALKPVWIDLASDEPGLDLPAVILPSTPDSLNEILDGWDAQVQSNPPAIDIDGQCHINERPKESDYQKFSAGCAVIVKGTPSLQVLEDGTISLGLFRSSSASPGGGWVDGPPVRMPDGSCFEHEHWTHTFEYRLMPHDGDWRDAGVHESALEFNHPLEASVTEKPTGDLQSSGSFIDIGTGSTFIQAIRPCNLSDTTFDHPERPVSIDGGLLLRLRELHGNQQDIKFNGNFDPVRIDLLGQQIDQKSTDLITPWEIASFQLKLNTSIEPDCKSESIDNRLQPKVLHPARYWRSSLGPCGWRAQPLFHHFLAKSVELNDSEPVELTLQVVCNVNRPVARAAIEFTTPDGVIIDHQSAIEIPDTAFEHIDFRINVSRTALSVSGFINAILTTSDGIRTVASVPVNLPAPIKISLPDAIILNRKSDTLDINISNEIGQDVEGFIELILPFEAWNLVEPGDIRVPVTVAGSKDGQIHIPLSNTRQIDPGRYYAVVKGHFCEEQVYSNACWIVVPDVSGSWIAPEQGRVVPFTRPSVVAEYSLYIDPRGTDPVGIDFTGSTAEFELSQKSKAVSYGLVTRKTAEISECLLHEPGKHTISANFKAGDNEWQTVTDFISPSGPGIFSKPLQKPLTFTDNPEKWADALHETSVEFTFRTEPDGPTDKTLILPVWIGDDAENLYVMTRIPWHSAVNPFTKRAITQADSLMLAFFPSRISELGFATTKDGPFSWTCYEIMDAPRPKSPPVSIDRDTASTTYRTVIPWSMIYLDQRPAVLPFNMVLNTVDNCGNWAGAWAISDGTVFKKTVDGSEFGLIIFHRPVET